MKDAQIPEADRIALGELVKLIGDRGVVIGGMHSLALPGWNYALNVDAALDHLTVDKQRAGRWLGSLQRAAGAGPAVDVWAFGKHYGCPVSITETAGGRSELVHFARDYGDRKCGPRDPFDGKSVPQRERITLREFADLYGSHAQVLQAIFWTGQLLDFDDEANVAEAMEHLTVDRLTVACWQLRWLPGLDPGHPLCRWSQSLAPASGRASLALFSRG